MVLRPGPTIILPTAFPTSTSACPKSADKPASTAIPGRAPLFRSSCPNREGNNGQFPCVLFSQSTAFGNAHLRLHHRRQSRHAEKPRGIVEQRTGLEFAERLYERGGSGPGNSFGQKTGRRRRGHQVAGHERR